MKTKQPRLLDYWPLFFLLSFLEAAVALLALLRIPTEGEGFSVTRWAVILPLLGMIVVSSLAVYSSWRNSNFRNNWLNIIAQPKLYGFLSIIFPLLAAATIIGAFLLRWWDPDQLLPFFERAWPLLAFIILFCIQSTVWLLLLRFGIHKPDFVARKPALFAFTILLFVFVFISLTGLGVTPDPSNPGEPGIAIQGWQMGLALILSALSLPLSLLPSFNSNSRRTDFIISVLIWVLAAGIWLSVPNEVLKNSFYFPIDPPANMPLPYSDSGYYDYMAHSLLIGTDYTGIIPTRPMYIVFLTALHLLFGNNYNLIIIGQTIVLASIPILFFVLGKKLHSRTAGITIALLAIFREWTSLLVSSETRVSNSKILLVDTPTLLMILLAIYFAFRWLERRDILSAFIAGGVFGITLLIRSQSMVIVLFLISIAFFALRHSKRPWLVPVLIFLLGAVITIAPWLTHNYLRIGKFSFDAPFQYKVLASQYAYTGNLDFAAVDLENKSLSQILITFALKDPGFVAGFITNHFLTTEVGAMLSLPLIYPFEGLREPVNLYWTTFDSTITWQNSLLLLSYLAVIAVGLGSAWKRWRWIGLLPLTFNLGYAAANGIGRFSGWRYNLPADWIAYFYFGIGVAEIFLGLAKIFGARIPEPNQTVTTGTTSSIRNPIIYSISIAATFMLIGGLPWIAESINPPPRYRGLEPTVLQAQIVELQTDVSETDVQKFVTYPESIILTGRLLYPRTFSKNSGLTSSTPWPSYAPRDFPRLGFKLLNYGSREIVFPNKGVTIENVQGEDVIVLGCEREDYIEARLLVFPNADITYLSNLALGPCSQ